MMRSNIRHIDQLRNGDKVEFLDDFPHPDPIMPADYEHTVEKGSIGTILKTFPERA